MPKNAHTIKNVSSIQGLNTKPNQQMEKEICYDPNVRMQYSYYIYEMQPYLNEDEISISVLPKIEIEKKIQENGPITDLADNKQLLNILFTHNEFLKNINTRESEKSLNELNLVYRKLINSQTYNNNSNSNFLLDQTDKLTYMNILKYIKLGDRFLYEEVNIEKSLSTFLFALNMVEELFEILQHKSEDSKIIPEENKNQIFFSPSKSESISKCSSNFLKFLSDNEDSLNLIRFKIFHSIIYIYECKENFEKMNKFLNKLLIFKPDDYQVLTKLWLVNSKDNPTSLTYLTRAIKVCNNELVKTKLQDSLENILN